MFNAMLDGIKEESVTYLFHLEVEFSEQDEPAVAAEAPEAEGVGEAEPEPEIVAKGLKKSKRPSSLSYSAPTVDDASGVEEHVEDVQDDIYVGVSRNDPCPCGSGKKFKRCHGDPRHAE
jgi:preprotein translocase subunit SecA